MSNQPTPGGLLRQARKRAGLSARRAADIAEVSEALWRQTELGYRNAGHGIQVPVKTGAERLRRMADAVNADAAAVLAAAGYDADEATMAPAGDVPLEAQQLLARVRGLPAEQTARWFRLARALADTLASESTGSSESTGIGTATEGYEVVPIETGMPGVSATGLVGRVADMQEEIRQVIARNVADMQRQESEDQDRKAR